jgi:hypothetical protein
MPKRKRKRLTPCAHLLLGRRTSRMTWLEIHSEYIDNSFGAGQATEYHAYIDDGWFVCCDNGAGAADLDDLLQLGKTSSSIDSISTYGIGAKDAMMSVGSVSHLFSVHNHKLQANEVDWDACIHGDFPLGAEPGKRATRNNAPDFLKWPDGYHGVAITTLMDRTGKARRAREKLLHEELGWRYGPAIRNGRRILIDGVEVKETTLPNLQDTVELSGEVEGRPFSLKIGSIVDAKDSNRDGFHFVFGHRVIERTDEPMGELYSPGVFAVVELGPEWKASFAVHKNEIVHLRDELFSAIFGLCEEFLKEKYSVADIIESCVFLDAMNEQLSGIRLVPGGDVITTGGGHGEGEREPGPGPGPNIDGEEDAEGEDDPEAEERKKKLGAIGIDFKKLSDPNQVVDLKFDPTVPALKVFLNENNEWILNLKTKPFKIPQTTMLVVAAATSELVRHQAMGGESFFIDVSSNEQPEKLTEQILSRVWNSMPWLKEWYAAAAMAKERRQEAN